MAIKVTLFKLDKHYYVIPYMYTVSINETLVKAANAYIASKDMEKELSIYKIECPTIKMAQVIKGTMDIFILANDKSILIASTNESLGLPTISEDICRSYDEAWDGAFMFPTNHGVEGVGLGQLNLEITDTSWY